MRHNFTLCELGLMWTSFERHQIHSDVLFYLPKYFSSKRTLWSRIKSTSFFSLIIIYNKGSPSWCKGGALDLWSKGQWFDPWRRQLEKEKSLFRWPSGCWATMSAAVHLIHVHFPIVTYLCEKNTLAKHKHWCGWADNTCLGEKSAANYTVLTSLSGWIGRAI